MERGAWTDERLDDQSRRIDAGFGRLDTEMRELRRELGLLRIELHSEIAAFRLTQLRVGGGIMIGLVGVIAAVLIRGGA